MPCIRAMRLVTGTCAAAHCSPNIAAFSATVRLQSHRRRCSTKISAYLSDKDSQIMQQAKGAGERFGYAVLEAGKKLEPYRHNPGPLGQTEVDIRVTHNGLCHTDIHMRDNDWGISGFPFIPGHEAVGVVEAVGDQAPSSIKVGDLVGVGWISDSCRKCPHCLRGEENICYEGYTGLIVNGAHGGFQTLMRAPADFTYKIPKGLAPAAAAPLLCAGVTVYSPLRRLITRPAMKVAVMGVGGLGHLAIQFADKMGADVTAIDISQDKQPDATGMGAERFVLWEKAVEGECKGAFDVVLNCASAKADIGKLLSLLKPDGKVVQIGIPGGGVQLQLPLQDLVFGQKSVQGSIVGGRADMQEMLEFAASKGVAPLIEEMPLSKVNEAMDRVASGKARYRVVLVTDEDLK